MSQRVSSGATKTFIVVASADRYADGTPPLAVTARATGAHDHLWTQQRPASPVTMLLSVEAAQSCPLGGEGLRSASFDHDNPPPGSVLADLTGAAFRES